MPKGFIYFALFDPKISWCQQVEKSGFCFQNFPELEFRISGLEFGVEGVVGMVLISGSAVPHGDDDAAVAVERGNLDENSPNLSLMFPNARPFYKN